MSFTGGATSGFDGRSHSGGPENRGKL
jgi:hypothetical protein